MTIYDGLLRALKRIDKSIDDVEFIRIEPEDEESFAIKAEDFYQIAKNFPIDVLEVGVFIVGKDFYLSGDDDDNFTDSFGDYEENYFFARTIPKKPEKEVNITKEMLLDKDALYELGIIYTDEDDE